jgi:homoserine kinase
VAAVVAANAFLDEPLVPARLLPYAAEGERAASGAAHADNVAAGLLGGLTAVVSTDPPEALSIPVPSGLVCVLVRPHLQVQTRAARQALPRDLPLGLHVQQSMRLAGFLAGCFLDDLDRVRRSMADLVAEPVRSRSIPGFAEARELAERAGAVGFGIAGSGPSVFAWTDSPETAQEVEQGIRRCFAAHDLAAESWTGRIREQGAVVQSRSYD